MTEKRTETIDFIRGIAVVLYHLGILSNGCLGVDISGSKRLFNYEKYT